MDPPAFRRAVRALAKDCDRLAADLQAEAPPAWRVLNVHAHALPAYEAFLARYHAPREGAAPPVAAIAMNPGKFGAVQTGIPFTDVPRARELLGPGFDALVDRRALGPDPPRQNREPSGRRVWGWGLARWGSAEAFCADLLVLLTCPVAILDGQGTRTRNVPLDALPREMDARCLQVIARHAPRLLKAAKPRGVLLMGRYGEGVWERLVETGAAPDLPVARCLHPAAHVNDLTWQGVTDAAWRALERPRGGRRASPPQPRTPPRGAGSLKTRTPLRR